MQIRMTLKGSNGEKFTSIFKPFKVLIEDGMTTVYLTKEDAIALKNDIKFKTSWWNTTYSLENEET